MIVLSRWHRVIRFCTGVLFITLGATFGVRAQVGSNTDHAIGLIVTTADSVLKSNGVQGFKLDFTSPVPVRLKLIQRLMDLGYRVYEMPTETAEITTLTVDPTITYRYVDGGRSGSSRRVDGTIGITLSRRDGSVTAAHSERIDDRHPVTARPSDLDDGSWPMAAFASIDDGGRRRGLKRLLEPALIVSAVAITVYLLFNVRSQ